MRRAILVLTIAIGSSLGAQDKGMEQKSYRLSSSFAIPGTGTTNYITFDSVTKRLFASVGGKIKIVSSATGDSQGELPDAYGYAAAVASNLGRVFAANEKTGKLIIYDENKLTILDRVSINASEYIVYDGLSKRVFPLAPKTTVVDGESGRIAGTIDLGADPQMAVSDERGEVFVSLDKTPGEIAVIDSNSVKVIGTFLMKRCDDPHSLSYDGVNQRLFVGCSNGLDILDSHTGKEVAQTRLCSGEGGSGFDPESKLIVVSCAEGVVSVIQQLSADSYQLVDAISTHYGALRMAFDAREKHAFILTDDRHVVLTADSERPFELRRIPGTARVLIAVPR
jgi:DNA-binding beta-propeller fold protein YncE